MKQYPQLPLLDLDGLHRLPIRLYLVLLLLLRPYLCWIVTLTLPEQQRDVLSWFYPLSTDFIRACLISLPALLLFAAVSQRVPYDKKLKRGRAKQFWFAIWRQGRYLLLAVTALDLYWTVQHLPPYVALHAPSLLIMPVALLLTLYWLLRNKLLPLIFSEWPEDKADSVKK